MDDGNYDLFVRNIDEAGEALGPPTLVQAVVERVDETEWTATLNGHTPMPAGAGRRVRVELSDAEGTSYEADADYDPARAPHLVGVGPFQAAP